MTADIERLAAELAALSPEDRELVLARMRTLGVQAREVGHRLQRRVGHTWADLIGENLYDTFGVAVAVVKSVNLTTTPEDVTKLRHDMSARHRRTVGGDVVVEIKAYGIQRRAM